MNGHAPGCTHTGPLEPEPPPRWDGLSWLDWMLKAKAARKAANGAPQPPTSTQRGESRAGHITITRSADELEAWAKAGIDDELDDVETDPPGTRNDALNKRALRCFRLALAAEFDFDDVHDALVGACRVNGLIDDDGIRSVLGTLRSARRKAIADGPAYPDDPTSPRSTRTRGQRDQDHTTAATPPPTRRRSRTPSTSSPTNTGLTERPAGASRMRCDRPSTTRRCGH